MRVPDELRCVGILTDKHVAERNAQRGCRHRHLRDLAVRNYPEPLEADRREDCGVGEESDDREGLEWRVMHR